MIEIVRDYIVPAAYAVLPDEMASPEATALLLAIGLQESRFEHRRQIGGPARGWFQFEVAGVRGVLDHPATAAPIAVALRALRYDAATPAKVLLDAIEDNDVLAACFARCLLWTSPLALGGPQQGPQGWRLYASTWRPGKPHPEVWQANYAGAWARVQGGLNA